MSEELQQLLEPLRTQVKAMTDAVQAQLERNDQAFQQYQALSAKLSDLIDHMLVLNEALTKSLSESDAQVDDLAKITALYQQLLQQQQNEQQEG